MISHVRRTFLPDDPTTGGSDPRLRVIFDLEAELGTSCVITARGPRGAYLGEGLAGPREGLSETSTQHEDVTVIVGFEKPVEREVKLDFDCRPPGEWPKAL